MIIAPRRGEVVTDKGIPNTRFAVFLEDIQNTTNQLIANSEAYTATNVTPIRSFDANTVALEELADVVGTLIADLKAAGVIP